MAITESVLFDGKVFSRKIDEETLGLSRRFYDIRGRKPRLAIIDPAQTSENSIYGRSKIKKGEKLSIECYYIRVPEPAGNKSPLAYIENLLMEAEPDGIIMERPLPPWISERDATQIVPDYLDVEGINLLNMGKNMAGEKTIIPATADACLQIIESLDGKFGKDVCIVNRTKVVGRPLALALINRNYTVTVCHSQTVDLKEKTSRAGIVVTATGKPEYLDSSYISKGAAVIDVGITRTEKGVVGDANFPDIQGKAGFITPVPGGVGPVTTSILMKNFMTIAIKRLEDRLNY
ncbi:MAG: bifunctional 5,10-methylenetetrahydrofolate dehydrogenase/5,10-methenyltetrahydrofolate cyclohydrolase [Candidatus Thermoplasmatota archaeon]|jgi:methylenetetrahydrofolate dehydrogenase (NADP+)/methenyltetrahydrofolate cyclohydrolase|nr:bifunctional 5,10-methylenetetrahydrofolate dehydrogenase/5,10-methenyltetrahydrofolate cyclohydrolase [Candidatus Thermoplasmatota archaeon]MCL5987616.1 bifunctional 5,10-methylenetetrahydrofolate dehydrogenase/5,10-methenyltetrahydrofolate cyclohydrolase [Candidatus Thermoplasmatota archaeon]